MTSFNKKREWKKQMAFCAGTKGSVWVPVTKGSVWVPVTKEQEGNACRQQIIGGTTEGRNEK